ncbi:hypothetical protein V2O64_22915 [Verrucomicrobiaceae bacterium 227]
MKNTKLILSASLFGLALIPATGELTVSVDAPTDDIIASNPINGSFTRVFAPLPVGNANHGRGNFFITADNPDGPGWSISSITIQKQTAQTFSNDTLRLWVFKGTGEDWELDTDTDPDDTIGGDGDEDGDIFNGTGITEIPVADLRFNVDGTYATDSFLQFNLESPITLEKNTSYGFLLQYLQSDGEGPIYFQIAQQNLGVDIPESQFQLQDTKNNFVNRNPLTFFVQGTSIQGAAPALNIKKSANPAGIDFSWDSSEGKFYNLRATTALDTPVSSWPTVLTGIAANPPVNNITLIRPGDAKTFYVLEETLPPALLRAGFETGADGFTAVNNTDGTIWEVGTPNSIGISGAVNSGNDGSTACWGTNIGNPGYYTPGTDTSLISPIVDLTDISAAALSFAQVVDVANDADPLFNTAVVNILEADTDTVIAAAIHTSTPDPDLDDNTWNTVSNIAIPAEALGQRVRFEFRFTGAIGDDFLGWYIDDIEVEAP